MDHNGATTADAPRSSIETPQTGGSAENSLDDAAHRAQTDHVVAKLSRFVDGLRAALERQKSKRGPKPRPEDVLPPQVLAMPFGYILKNFSKFTGVDQAHLKFFFQQVAGRLSELEPELEPQRNASKVKKEDGADQTKADAPANCKTSAACSCCTSQKTEQ
ncbi:hypothetical protein F4811DRAFT_285845 [Daldinia bambusicola]|nr:hypothetical protein F4811DRAFT_285845 [Daldinia bambusicola]